MKTDLIDRKYRKFSEIIEEDISEIIAVLDDPDFSTITDEMKDLYDSLKKPFMFVVIGEVKAGKSSVINALTGENICPVDADICTNRVRQIVYAQDPHSEIIETFIELTGINSPLLKDISIVDTPGTDSIIGEHEAITRRFAPNSNIIFFVFPALNPHHSSSWEMLRVMKDSWSRNIIFIAAQSDRCTPAELETGIRKIGQYARERGIAEPVIFPTSSKLELEGKAGLSGFADVRDFITDTTRGGAHMLMKLKDRLEIASIILKKAESKLLQRREILLGDISLRKEIDNKYESGIENSLREIGKILERMNFVFEKTTGEYMDMLRKSLSPGNILRQALPLPGLRTSKNKVDRYYFEKILGEMNVELEKKLSREAADNASFFIDGIKFRFSEIMREVEKARELENSGAAEEALSAFISRRDEMLQEILAGLSEMSTDISLISALERHNPDIGDTVMKGGIIAVAGALLSLVAQGAVFDATGGILSALGILGAGGVILFKRNKVLKEFKKSIANSRDRFSRELQQRFHKRTDLIFEDILRLFEKIDGHIDNETRFIEKASSLMEKKRIDFEKLKSSLG